MIKKILCLFMLTISLSSSAKCVHEESLFGFELAKKLESNDVYILNKQDQFIKIIDNKGVNLNLQYQVQLLPKAIIGQKSNGDFREYNRKHIEYYRYQRALDYFEQNETKLNNLGYQKRTIGKSIEGRKLLAITPKVVDKNKKTIIMLGRHHGDEGTASWIIEGFVSQFLKQGVDFHSKYQLLLYPMINPDGAEAQTRYNKNGRDLNRVWSMKPDKNLDEVSFIHSDLNIQIKDLKNIVVALDMHGSFSNDFIYRVEKNFLGASFFYKQQDYIDELSSLDKWQKGSFQLSNGHPRMARIVLIKGHGINALTHETVKNIKLSAQRSRKRRDLLYQGQVIVEAINNLN